MQAVNKPQLLVLLFFALSLCLFSRPIEDGDFFWHLRTGEWIAQHKSLPAHDPFSYTVEAANPFRPDSGRVPFILKQYWMGQLALHGIWNLAGSVGIVALRTLLYTAVVAFAYLWMRRLKSGALPLFLAILIAHLLSAYPNERPQLFSFLFMPLVLFLLERLRSEVASVPRLTGAVLASLMLLWANTHGAYLLGMALVCIYLGVHLALALAGREKFNGPLVGFGLLACLVTLANPNGWGAFVEFIHTLPTYAQGVEENITPFSAALSDGEYFPAYWAFLLLTLTTLVLKFREIRPVHFVVLAALVLLSLSGLRHMPYLLLAAPLLVFCWPEIPWGKWSGIAVIALLVFCVATADFRQALQFRTARGFPEKAVAFIDQTKPAGRIFNFYDWGGYLLWYLPEYPVFTDGRGLVEEIVGQHDTAMWEGGWQGILDSYEVNIVLIPGLSQYSGRVYPLALNLYRDAHWHLVYRDEVALVFVREGAENTEVIARYALPKHELHRHIVARVDWLLADKKPSRTDGFWLTRGNSEWFLGDAAAARESFRKVLEEDPQNAQARRMLGM